ncbi:SurA N-terminal domain-containing protein [Solidesulfovibrio sp.]
MLDPMRKYAQSWGIKLIFGLIIIVFVFWGVGSFQGDKATLLATVDDQPILIKDYEKAFQENLRLVKSKNPNVTDKDLQDGGFRWQVFGNMVTTLLLENQAQKLGITVTPEELRAEIAKIPAFQNESKQFDTKRYETLLKANDLSPGEFESDFRQQLLQEKVVSFVGLPATVAESEARSIFDFMREQAVITYLPFAAADFAKDVTISDEQIKTYYDGRKDEFATPAQVRIDFVEFTPRAMSKPAEITEAEIEADFKANAKKYERPEQVHVRHILMMLPPDAPKDVVDAAEARMKAMAEQVRKGADFATLIPKDATNPDGILGEDWAWLPKGSLPKEFGPFEEKAFALKKDEVSEPVRTTLGLHLIQGGERQAAGQRTLAEVKDDIRAELAEQRAADKLTKALDVVQEKLSSGEPLEAAVAAEQVALKTSEFFAKDNPPADLGLSEQALEAIFALKKGQTADAPLSTQDGFLLVRAAEIKEPGVEPLEAVADVIKTRLTSEEALKRAKAKADEAAKAMETPEGQKKLLAENKAKIATSQPFSRQGFIPGLGMAPVLVQTAFEAREPGWFKTAFGVSGAYVLAGLDKRIPADPTLWDKEKERWMATLTQSKQTELFRAYVQTLQQGAQVEVINEAILGPQPKGMGGEAGK